jgi:autophagy-related protein 33
MGKRTVAISKFVGTVSLGLLTVRVSLLPQQHFSHSISNVPRLLYPPSNLQALKLTSIHQGLSYTTSHTSLPSLLSLPSAPTCAEALAHLRQTVSTQRTLLTTLSVLPLSIAYIVSPRRAKHPYLLWTVLVAALATHGLEPLLASPLLAPYVPADPHVASVSAGAGAGVNVSAGAAEGHDATSVGSSGGSDDGIDGVKGSWVGVKGAREAEEGKSEEEVNGEVVRARVERWRATEVIRTGVSGLAFAMAVVGIWGDGF